jgi:hypothetical protein
MPDFANRFVITVVEAVFLPALVTTAVLVLRFTLLPFALPIGPAALDTIDMVVIEEIVHTSFSVVKREVVSEPLKSLTVPISIIIDQGYFLVSINISYTGELWITSVPANFIDSVSILVIVARPEAIRSLV